MTKGADCLEKAVRVLIKKIMGEIITLQPIEEKKPEQFTREQITQMQFNFAVWRFHLWGLNVGSYNQIERMVKQGKLTPGVCPKADCNCSYAKQ